VRSASPLLLALAALVLTGCVTTQQTNQRYKLRDEVAVVIVTHNLQQAYRIADYVAFMYLGELVEYGMGQTIFAAPREQRTREYVSGAFG